MLGGESPAVLDFIHPAEKFGFKGIERHTGKHSNDMLRLCGSVEKR